MDIKAYNKNWELRKADLDWSHGKPFLCSSGVQGYDQFVMERNPGFNWIFPFYAQNNLCVLWGVRVIRALLNTKRKTKQDRTTTCLFSLIYIYILHITHTQFGPLDLMSQLSELGWAHRNQAIMCPTHYGP